MEEDPLGGRHYHMVVLTNKKLLLDEANADLVIKVGNEVVHAHAAVVSSRCPDIIGIPQDEKSKKKKKQEVKVQGVASGAIMTKVLEYLYTGQVDFSKLSDKEILLLTSAARHLKLGRLVFLSEKWLREHMTIESVFHLLKAATDLNETRAKGFCLEFALQHYNEFISNKDGIYILGIELFQEVVAAFQTNPQPPTPLRVEDNQDTLLADFKKMYDQMAYSDVSFQLGSETIKAHKAVLIAHSEGFNALIRDDSNLRISPAAFKSMLRFLYYGDDDIETIPACELIAFSRTLKLSTLGQICEEKIRDSISVPSVLSILSITYLPADGGKQELANELRGKCFPFILQHLDEIDFSRLKTYNPMMIVDLLFTLQSACKKGELNFSAAVSSAGGSQDTGFSSGKRQDRSTSNSKQQSSAGLLGQQRSRPPAPPPRDKALPPPSLSTPASDSGESSEKRKTSRKRDDEKREKKKSSKSEKKSSKGK